MWWPRTLRSTGLCRALLGACRYLLFAACAAVDSDSHGHRSQSILDATYSMDNSDKKVKIMFDIYVHYSFSSHGVEYLDVTSRPVTNIQTTVTVKLGVLRRHEFPLLHSFPSQAIMKVALLREHRQAGTFGFSDDNVPVEVHLNSPWLPQESVSRPWVKDLCFAFQVLVPVKDTAAACVGDPVTIPAHLGDILVVLAVCTQCVVDLSRMEGREKTEIGCIAYMCACVRRVRARACV